MEQMTNSLCELKNMDIGERDKYYNKLDEQIILNPEYLEIYEEQIREDMRTSEIEDYNISPDNDDY